MWMAEFKLGGDDDKQSRRGHLVTPHRRSRPSTATVDIYNVHNTRYSYSSYARFVIILLLIIQEFLFRFLDLFGLCCYPGS